MRRPTLGIWGIILCFYLSIADRNFRSVYMELFEAKEGGTEDRKVGIFHLYFGSWFGLGFFSYVSVFLSSCDLMEKTHVLLKTSGTDACTHTHRELLLVGKLQRYAASSYYFHGKSELSAVLDFPIRSLSHINWPSWLLFLKAFLDLYHWGCCIRNWFLMLINVF